MTAPICLVVGAKCGSKLGISSFICMVIPIFLPPPSPFCHWVGTEAGVISSRSETWGQHQVALNASSTTDWHCHSHNSHWVLILFAVSKPRKCPVQWLFISESSNDVFTIPDYQHGVSNCDFNESWHETKSGKQCQSVISLNYAPINNHSPRAYLGIFQIHMIKTSHSRIEEGCIIVPAGLWSPGLECLVSAACIFV